eukprot:5040864-Amphidinium_carterae.2
MAFHDYLGTDSSHPASTFTGAAVGETVRHIRRPSTFDAADTSLLLLVPRLVKRGYDERIIKQRVWYHLKRAGTCWSVHRLDSSTAIMRGSPVISKRTPKNNLAQNINRWKDHCEQRRRHNSKTHSNTCESLEL